MAYSYFIKILKFPAICVFLLLNTIQAAAQISIFNQKSTQTKYLLQQNAALKVYTDYLKKGYGIVKDGTRLVTDIKNGEFGLHKKYFSSLKAVSSAIKKSPKAQAVYQMVSDMERQRVDIYVLAEALPPSTAADLTGVLRAIAAQSTIDLDALLMVLEDGAAQLTDDQRIKRIGTLYERVQKSWSLQRELFKDTKSLIAYLEYSSKDIEQQGKLQ